MSDEVLVTLEKGLRTIKVNRPRTKNAYNSNVYKTITRTLNEDATRDDVVVTILTASGEYYSSGFDIKDSMSQGVEEANEQVRGLIKALINYPKLVIALVNGPAIGIGVTSAALCDIIYASDRATFQTPFLKLGLCAEGCSSYTFVNIMGRSKGSEVLLLGKKLDAREALRVGFVAEVVPHEKLGEFYQSLEKLGEELTANSIKVNKKLIMDNVKNVLCECCDREMATLSECQLSEEFSEAMRRFMSRKSKL